MSATREVLDYHIATLVKWIEWVDEASAEKISGVLEKGQEAWHEWLSNGDAKDVLVVHRVLAEVRIDCIFPESAVPGTIASIRQATEVANGDEVLTSSGPAPSIRPHTDDMMYSLEYDVSIVDECRAEIDKHKRETQGSASDSNMIYNRMVLIIKLLCEYLPYSEPFLNRVSEKDVPDYYEIIEEPMDFDTLRTNVQNGVYGTNWEKFERDLRLIYSNCLTYNYSEGNPYAAMSRTMETRTNLLISAFKSIPDNGYDDVYVSPLMRRKVSPPPAKRRREDSGGGEAKSTNMDVDVPNDQEAAVLEAPVDMRVAKYLEETAALRRRRVRNRYLERGMAIGNQTVQKRKRRRACRSCFSMGVWCFHNSVRNVPSRPDINFFPELLDPADGIPPLDSPVLPTTRESCSFRFDIGEIVSNPVLGNIERIQKIRRLRRLLMGDITSLKYRGPNPVDSWPVLLSSNNFTGEASACDMNRSIALNMMSRGVGVILMHAGFEATEVDTVSQLSKIGLDKIDSMCKSVHEMCDAHPQSDLVENANKVMQKTLVGGRNSLKSYWDEDVIGFGEGWDRSSGQLKHIYEALKGKYKMCLAMEQHSIELPDNDVGILTGNFGNDVGDLGLDILGLKEMELAEVEGIPDKLLRNQQQIHSMVSSHGGAGLPINFVRPYQAGSEPRPTRAATKKDPVVPRKFAVPTPWPTIKAENQIKLLAPFLETYLKLQY